MDMPRIKDRNKATLQLIEYNELDKSMARRYLKSPR